MQAKNLNFSVDLLIGTPFSESRDLENELNGLLKFGPSHFSVYILNARANYPHKKNLPEDEISRDQYLLVSNFLTQKGFEHYEVSNFAKTKELESSHNKRYWDFKSVAAVGPNATGTICSPEEVFRYQWKSLSDGFQVETVAGSSLLIEKLFLSLRRSEPVDLSSLLDSSKLSKNLDSKLENWHQLGYVLPDSKINNIRVTPQGYLMNDSMLSDLMDLI